MLHFSISSISNIEYDCHINDWLSKLKNGTNPISATESVSMISGWDGRDVFQINHPLITEGSFCSTLSCDARSFKPSHTPIGRGMPWRWWSLHTSQDHHDHHQHHNRHHHHHFYHHYIKIITIIKTTSVFLFSASLSSHWPGTSTALWPGAGGQSLTCLSFWLWSG